ncbi:hypothetical protein C1147_02750, partial [Clostridium botulinum]
TRTIKIITTNINEKNLNNFEEINQFFQQNISKFGLKKGSLKSTKTLKDEKAKLTIIQFTK